MSLFDGYDASLVDVLHAGDTGEASGLASEEHVVRESREGGESAESSMDGCCI